MKSFNALGLMSGTSMDGIDVALIRSDGVDSVARGASLFVPYATDTRTRLEQGLKDAADITVATARPGILAALETELTSLNRHAVEQFIEQNKLNASEIDIIGFHGQTVLHRPDEGLTVQLGHGQALADETGIPVTYDMRTNDMRHGGEGAPLVPAYHRALARQQNMTENAAVVFVNVGGISNVTYVGQNDELIAFDCGTGNGLIDQWVKSRAGLAYDEGGGIAAKGNVIEPVVARYLAHPYFDLPVPKSLDRKDFNPLEDDTISLEDGARSLARVSALSIAGSAQHFPTRPGRWIICGGGTQNAVIMQDLRELLENSGTQVLSADEAGLSSAAMEAEAFAYLAIRSKLGLEYTWPTTTGCHAPQTGGIHCVPQNRLSDYPSDNTAYG